MARETISSASSPIADVSPHGRNLYERRTSLFSILNSAARVAILGDSRVQGAEWGELLGRADVANRGISGDTTGGLLARLAESVPATAVLCVIQIGINDLFDGVAVVEVEGNLREIIARIGLLQPPPKVALMPVMLCAEVNTELNERTAELNDRLEKLAREQELIWIDCNEVLCPAGWLEPKWTNDGVHLHGEAYRLLAAQLRPYLPAD